MDKESTKRALESILKLHNVYSSGQNEAQSQLELQRRFKIGKSGMRKKDWSCLSAQSTCDSRIGLDRPRLELELRDWWEQGHELPVANGGLGAGAVGILLLLSWLYPGSSCSSTSHLRIHWFG